MPLGFPEGLQGPEPGGNSVRKSSPGTLTHGTVRLPAPQKGPLSWESFKQEFKCSRSRGVLLSPLLQLKGEETPAGSSHTSYLALNPGSQNWLC